MPKFRKRLADIEAVRVDDILRADVDKSLRRELPAWVQDACDTRMLTSVAGERIIVHFPTFWSQSWREDWITRDTEGNIIPRTARELERDYEPIED